MAQDGDALQLELVDCGPALIDDNGTKRSPSDAEWAGSAFCSALKKEAKAENWTMSGLRAAIVELHIHLDQIEGLAGRDDRSPRVWRNRGIYDAINKVAATSGWPAERVQAARRESYHRYAEQRAHAPPAAPIYVPSARAWDRQKIYDAIERQAADGNWTLERKRAVQDAWDRRIARDHTLLVEKKARERAAGRR